jgi:membrane-bound metal-dependent hydrolase YbcI (DUF457 family)
MFIGHYAPALIAAACPSAPRLGALFVAAQLVDFAFFGFVALGIEHARLVPGFTVMNALDLYDMRYTHSLAGTLLFALGWLAIARLAGSAWVTAMIGAAVVASHWFLDLLVHAPDLTIAGSGSRYGFALWNHPMIEMPLEIALTAAALGFYLVRTRPHGRAGILAPSILATALAFVQVINWAEPQPDRVIDPAPLAQSLLALAVFTALALLAAWTGRSRIPRLGPRLRTL